MTVNRDALEAVAEAAGRGLTEAWSEAARKAAAETRRAHVSANGHRLEIGHHAELGGYRGRVEGLTHAIDGTPQVQIRKGDGSMRGGPASEAHRLSSSTTGGLTKIGDRMAPPPRATAPAARIRIHPDTQKKIAADVARHLRNPAVERADAHRKVAAQRGIPVAQVRDIVKRHG